MSVSRAAPKLLKRTVMLPLMMVSGGPTQTHIPVMVAAGKFMIRTVGTPGGKIGPPTCGTGPVNIGQTCRSVILAAGSPIFFRFF